MKVLIVDDNRNNRMILSLLLEDYEGVDFEIDEVQNGAEAIEAASEEKYDIIFMDIMMPQVDGIEATKQIRQKDPKVIIIAVSAMEDKESKNEILRNGAQDYLPKPINEEIFRSRMENYIALIEAKRHSIYNKEAVNRFTNKIYSRKLIFMTHTDKALSEFWDYYLFDHDEKDAHLTDVVRLCFKLGDTLLKKGSVSDIVVEESKNELYFSLIDISAISTKLIELIMHRSGSNYIYKIDDSIISFQVQKGGESQEEEIEAVDAKPQSAEDAAGAEPMHDLANELHIYDYINGENLEALEGYLKKLHALLPLVGRGGIKNEEITQIYDHLERIAEIVTSYPEAKGIGDALKELASAIKNSTERFAENSKELGDATAALDGDLTEWDRMIFHEGAPSVHFLDDTIVADVQRIVSILGQNEAVADGGGDLDDIFDF